MPWAGLHCLSLLPNYGLGMPRHLMDPLPPLLCHGEPACLRVPIAVLKCHDKRQQGVGGREVISLPFEVTVYH